MRILLAPHGTRGDVQPLLALALALRARGHEAAFVAPANFVAWIRGHGFPCQSDGVDIEAVLRSPGADLQSFRWQMRHLTTVLAPRLFESVARAAGDADLIVGSGVQIAAASVAERRGVPCIGVAFCPSVVPGRAAPPPMVRRQTLPRWVNSLLWRWGTPIADVVLRAPINAGRAQLGLAPIDRPTQQLAGDGIIVAADSDLAPLGADAPANVYATDAWVFDEPADLDPRLEAFLRQGSPPVYVGFGSMVAKNARDLVSCAVGAAGLVGCRLVVAGGWAGLDASVTASDMVLAIDSAPHGAIFPRVAAAIHHGGAGTTTAAARAGIPQVVVPHILDQYFWAHRILTLGLGPRSLPVERVTTGRLANRMAAALNEWRFRETARRIGARVAARDGVASAVHLLERLGVRCRA